MASINAANFQQSSSANFDYQPFQFDSTIKVIAESAGNLNAVPSKFNFTNETSTALTCHSLPTIDFSALTGGDPDQRSRAIHELGKACQEWGFFYLVNHGMPERLMNAMFPVAPEFFSLPHEELKQYEAKSASDPIKCGSFKVATASNETFMLWRDNLRMNVHPEFHCPDKPKVLRELVLDFTERSRGMAKELLKAISDNLGLEYGYVDEALKMDSSYQLFAINFYPPCPQPDKAIGLIPHTDPGLFTLLIHNGVAGLQIQHNGQWFNVDSAVPPNSILVNCADQLEIFTNGRYKSVVHRAVVNNEKERISIVMSYGPSWKTVVGPAAALAEQDGGALYQSMEYGEYYESKHTTSRHGAKTTLQQLMVETHDAN